MIEHELLLLGLLRESPKHGYEIKRKIKEILSLFAGVDLKSVYYPLRILEKKGLLEKRMAKPSRRPARIVYALTSKGKAHFDRLLEESLLSFKRPQFSLDLSLYFLHYMKPKVAHRRLRARQLILKKISTGLNALLKSNEMKKPSPLSRIIEHNLRMLEAEYDFLASLSEAL